MDVETINGKGISPVAAHLERVAELSSTADLAQLMAAMVRNGVMVPYELFIDPDLRDSSS